MAQSIIGGLLKDLQRRTAEAQKSRQETFSSSLTYEIVIKKAREAADRGDDFIMTSLYNWQADCLHDLTGLTVEKQAPHTSIYKISWPLPPSGGSDAT